MRPNPFFVEAQTLYARFCLAACWCVCKSYALSYQIKLCGKIFAVLGVPEGPVAMHARGNLCNSGVVKLGLTRPLGNIRVGQKIDICATEVGAHAPRWPWRRAHSWIAELFHMLCYMGPNLILVLQIIPIIIIATSYFCRPPFAILCCIIFNRWISQDINKI